ncbi:uncharacterized protein LOC103513684 [Diaphorina citri]|uniref:Uncharacterized protein LOC103513684 n=1 Tax=Diaphorina citri TaxID=121845 RepID=A0A1S3D8Q3_DIACI|nr:uncharacterized protein LOC103513684 [Diaphorina citri]
MFAGKSIKDLVSKDNMDENVQINDKPLWKQNDRSWISSLYKRAPSPSISSVMSSISSVVSSVEAQSVASSVEAQASNNVPPAKDPNEAPQPIATTVRAVLSGEETSAGEDKTSSSSNRTDKAHPRRDVYETIKEMLNEEDKFHQGCYNPFDNRDKNKVKDGGDVEVKELESQRSNLQDIISNYPLGSAGASSNVQDDMDDEYSPSSLGKSIKDLVSKDNMDENVQINDKPLWKQNDRSWISSLYKRAPSPSISSVMSSISSVVSSVEAQSVASSVEAQASNNVPPAKDPNEAPQPIATTVRAVLSGEETSAGEDKTSSSSNRTDKAHPRRDVYETIKEMLNEEDKFHQHGGVDIEKKKRSFISTEDELTKELGALRKS